MTTTIDRRSVRHLDTGRDADRERAARAELAAARKRHPAGRTYRTPVPGRFYLLLAVIVSLTLFGLVMVFSASSVMALRRQSDSWYYVSRQFVWSAIGLLALVVGAAVPYATWAKLARVALPIALCVTCLVFVPGLGIERNGARAWLGRGAISLQPSEFLKLAILVFVADLLTRRRDVMHRPSLTMLPALIMLAISCLVLLAQSDLGSAIVVAMIVLAVLFLGGAPFTPLFGATAMAAGVGVLAVLTEPYRMQRLLSFRDPWSVADSSGLQLTQSLMGIASGGWTGVGLGASRAKWGFLPEAHTDFIFAIIAEELGFVGVLVVVGLFALFALTGARVALTAQDRFGMLLAGGITAWILAQAIINFGAVVGLLPITGLTLPFISFGGSSLLVTMAAAGILLNIARTGKAQPVAR